MTKTDRPRPTHPEHLKRNPESDKTFHLTSSQLTIITRSSSSISKTMAAQCTPDRLLKSLHVSFSEDITTHIIPVSNEDDKAALHYSRKDLKAFKLAHKLRTQRKIAILMALIANRDALNKRKEENVKAIQFQTTESFYIAARSDLEERTWERTCCSKAKDCAAKSAPGMLPETRGSQLNGVLFGMANTNPHKSDENVQAMEFQKIENFYIGARATQEDRTCSDSKDCDATAILPKTHGSHLSTDPQDSVEIQLFNNN
jgi:hypothetical protein